VPATTRFLAEPLETEIGHDGRHDAAAAQPSCRPPRFRDQRHQLVAIDDRAVLVDDQHPIGVAIQRDADIGADFMDLARQRDRVGRTAIEIDVGAVGLVADRDHVGAQFPQSRRRHLVGRAIGAIDDDAHSRKRHILGQRPFGEFDVAVMHAIDTLGPADRIGTGQLEMNVLSIRPSISSSSSSDKLEAVRPKSLMPLS
jgi:hypothetical protein